MSNQAVQVAVAAVRVLADVLSGRTLPDCLSAGRSSLSAGDGALLQQLCYGTVRYYPRLEVVLDALLDKPSRKLHDQVRCLLLCGLYRLSDTRAPDYAVVDVVGACRSEAGALVGVSCGQCGAAWVFTGEGRAVGAVDGR